MRIGRWPVGRGVGWIGPMLLLLASPVRPAPAAKQSTAANDSISSFRELIRAHRGAEALARARTWCQTLERGVGPDTLLAAALDGWSEALLDQGAWGDSAAHAVASRAARVKGLVYGEASPGLAGSLLTQAWLLYRGSRPAEARPIAERSLAISLLAGAGSERLAVRSLHLRAALLEDAAEYTLADSCYRAERTIAAAIDGSEGALVANTENSMAILARKTGRPSDARPLYEHSLAIREKLLGPDHTDVAWSYNNLGNTLLALGDYPGAIARLRHSLEIRERTLPAQHPLIATVLHNLANAELRMGDTTAAEAHYRRALGIREAKLAEGDLLLGQTRAAIALICAARGDTAAGRSLARQSLLAAERSLGPSHPETASQHCHLGDVERFAGNPSGAIAEYGIAIGIVEQSLGRAASALVEPLTSLSGAELAAGLDSSAFAHASRAESLAVRDLETVASVLEERVALDFDTAVHQALDAMITAACRRPGSAERVTLTWSAITRSRSLVLDAEASRHRALLVSNDGIARQLADSLAAAREKLAHLSVRGASSRDLAVAATRVDHLEETLARSSAVIQKQLAGRHSGLGDVLGSLSTGEGLLGFARYVPAEWPGGAAERMVAFVGRAGDPAPRLFLLGETRELASRVAVWQRECSRRPNPLRPGPDEARCRRAGFALREAVWDPLASALAGLARILIVPEGALNEVNFGALPDRRTGWLVESGPVLTIMGAERDRIESVPAERGEGLLAVADPDFGIAPVRRGASREEPPARGAAATAPPSGYQGRHSSCLDFRATRFAPLPASAGEAAAIVALWDHLAGGERAHELTGARASEAAFKRFAPGRRELHLATHGFMLEGACPDVTAENALLRCGFALAGANRRDNAPAGADDGVLTGEEIGSLDLSSVDCAVLSACESGLGDVHAGEGVLGLQRAFRVAGARGLVMSLWPVGDAETGEWMNVFYRQRLERGLDPAAALVATERDMLRRRRAAGRDTHPWSWAGFVASTVGGPAGPLRAPGSRASVH